MSAHIKENNLIHCIYSSAVTAVMTHEDIIALLEKARAMNSGLGVTGMLLYEDGSFFQVLEGPAETVTYLYKKIDNDTRHGKVTKIIEEPIEERNFADWTMGYSDVTKEDLGKIEGLNDFFSSRKCYTELDECRTRKLLGAFKEGKWRVSIK